MKCKICRGEAIVRLPHYNMNLCREHFLGFIEKRVEQTIEKYKMFSRRDKVLVAVSGGKDSVTLWYVLAKLGYQADGVFLKLGHTDQVAPAMEIARKMAELTGRKLIIEDATQYLYGLSTFEAARLMRRPVCGFCGKVKRYLMNKVAVENGYDVLATGHNLDDEASLLLGNLLHWQTGYILRSFPVLEATHPKLVKKVKPHCFNYERDILTYAELAGLPYLKSSCPFSMGATLPVYKQMWDFLEKEQPSAKITFYKGFLREKSKIFKTEENRPQLKSCKICGYPTTGEVCSFCSSREVLQRRLEKIKSKS